MIFRIRYRQVGKDMEAEEVIQANSPAEAMVKFRHTRGSSKASRGQDKKITSVSPENFREDVFW